MVRAGEEKHLRERYKNAQQTAKTPRIAFQYPYNMARQIDKQTDGQN
jgi:hypothetical protein